MKEYRAAYHKYQNMHYNRLPEKTCENEPRDTRRLGMHNPILEGDGDIFHHFIISDHIW